MTATPSGPDLKSPTGDLPDYLFSHLIDVTGAEGNDDIARSQFREHHLDQLPPVGNVPAISLSRLCHSCQEDLCRDAVYSLFSGRVDVHDEETVDGAETRGELVHQVPRPCIPVRLKNNENPVAVKALARSLEHCPYLCRVVTVVIKNPYARRLALELKAALNAAEGAKGLLDDIEGHLQFEGRGYRCEAVEDIVYARDGDGEPPEGFPLDY